MLTRPKRMDYPLKRRSVTLIFPYPLRMLSINFALVIWDFCCESWTVEISIIISYQYHQYLLIYLPLTSDTTQSRHFSETVSCPRKIPSNQRNKESTDWQIEHMSIQRNGFSCQNLTCNSGWSGKESPSNCGEKVTSEWCRLQFSKNFPPIPRRFSLAFLWKITCMEVSKTPTKLVVVTLMGISMEGAS